MATHWLVVTWVPTFLCSALQWRKKTALLAPEVISSRHLDTFVTEISGKIDDSFASLPIITVKKWHKRNKHTKFGLEFVYVRLNCYLNTMRYGQHVDNAALLAAQWSGWCLTYLLAAAARHRSCFRTWIVMRMECRSVWAGISVLCKAAGAASFLGRSSPWAGSSHTDRMAWDEK